MRGPVHWVKSLAMRWAGASSWGWSGYWQGGYGYSHPEFGAVDPEVASVVMAPLLWMMRTFPEAPLTIDRKIDSEWEMQEDHPMAILLRRPNEYCSGDLLMQATVLSLGLDGDAYWIKVTDRQLRVKELWWVPNDTITPVWPSDGSTYVSHYEYKPGSGDKTILAPNEVVHLRWGIDPQNTRCGLSPLASVLREIGADEEAARFSASLLGNMGVPGLVVAPAAGADIVVGDDDLEASKAALEDAFTGARRGKPFVAGAPTTDRKSVV